MLVLSRRQGETLVFPNLDIQVQVLRIGGNAVRIGVNAPEDVRVLRQELVEKFQTAAQGPSASAQFRHELRNRMNTVGVALHLLERQLETGRLEQAEQTLQKALAEVARLDEQLAAQRAAIGAKLSSPSRRRALLVEDDANECELLAGYLRMSGFDVDTAGNGREAIQYLDGRRPDFMLLDMHLPEMDGPQTISSIRIRPEHRGLKVFAVSGADRSDVGVTIGPSGVDRWFSKPIDPRKLVQEINRDLECVAATA